MRAQQLHPPLRELEVEDGVLGAEVGELPDAAAGGGGREEAGEGEEEAAPALAPRPHDVADRKSVV